MSILMIIALLICIAGLYFTIIPGKRTDSSYSNRTATKNMTWMYAIVLPVLCAFLALFYYLLV